MHLLLSPCYYQILFINNAISLNFNCSSNNDMVQVGPVEYGSKLYEELVALRHEVLRKPLGLFFTDEQLAAEKDFIHFGAFDEDELVGTLQLVPEAHGRMKMKQVAVDSARQGQGIGAIMVQAAEEFARDKGFIIMYCHARDLAVPFYERLGYRCVGDMFEEVTIPHWEMEKRLE